MKAELLGTLFLSEKRKNLLLLLKEGEKDIDEIKRALNVNTSAIMTQINILMSQGLIVYQNNEYGLSSMGGVIVKKMQPLLETLNLYEDNRLYWENHKIEALPCHLLNRIEELGSCEFVEPDLDRMYDLPKRFEENLEKSKYIHEVSSYFSPAYSGLYKRLVEKGIEISLILTETVFERLKNEYQSDLAFYLGSGYVNLYVCTEKIELASGVVTDRFLALSLFYNTGIYHNHTMMSFESSAINWGKDLFSYYLDISRKISQDDF
ncbi:transcriptional regulator, ArsR family [Methanosalsum zhilinae DSM 4017]|uniref:Transcriptional regulator, ArsR family n=1 Tax=Methanosalsum zhilinae (strain DSM 4017 / NBRC 107636 / OCM 62 / WeN5) TaxID=679901 RepID=F7XQN0_METZD|nr:winged helix-turn-helix domain-containing protein [Methanosalsum zhilinae]AEH61629.1 transcriptional regulator, ArsR family [Methanosalsum zhilinae DSM 4017]